MARRCPPGIGPVIALLLVIRLIAAAQQQQPPASSIHRSSRQTAYIDTAIHGNEHTIGPPHARGLTKREQQLSPSSQNERAIATFVSAPVVPEAAVRAPSARSAAGPSGGIQSRPRARSLQDWEVEDFVLLATVDGYIHARDRNNGKERWSFYVGRPMVETIYHNQKSDSMGSMNDAAYLWIVEPTQHGHLYLYSPETPHIGVHKVGLTVKQLAEDLSPYASDDPPVVYTAEKRTTLYTLDARTGYVLKRFSSGGSTVFNDASCEHINEFAEREKLECKGTITIGQTEYEVTIQNRETSEPICTIRYFEWSPNVRDKDLQAQYEETMDKKYVLSRFDGTIYGMDHGSNRNRKLQVPIYTWKFSSPVVRVFDVARPFEDDSGDPSLIVLPQPVGPINSMDVQGDLDAIWVNRTDTGSWYAMSESFYPTVTDGAQKAGCYDWKFNENTDGFETLEPSSLDIVGVHSLKDVDFYPEESYLAISGPTGALAPMIDVVHEELPKSTQLIGPSAPKSSSLSNITGLLTSPLSMLFYLLFFTSLGWFGSDFLKKARSIQQVASAPEFEKNKPQDHPPIEPRRVRFETLEEHSHIIEAKEPPKDNVAPDEMSLSPADSAPTPGEEPINGADTPKKKKAHRGQRGGRKRKKNLKTETNDGENEDINRIVQVAKEIGQDQTLQPDQINIDVQNVADPSSGIIQLGKLTINTDRVIGNGSGGTFVFEGKWKERDVAVKRMLPQYFGLAEQEVTLLQQSDLHPNVIRYFDDERDQNFLYIAVELCQASLFDLYHDGQREEFLSENHLRLVNEINADIRRALYQLAAGLNHLHSLRIIHRDIKPQNILIAYPQKNQNSGPRLVISDFGLCKTLPDNVSTLAGTTGTAGTIGWKAPELILQPKECESRNTSSLPSRDSSSSGDPVSQGVKRAVDIFSLGCVFFYVLTNGSHPFDDAEGWMQLRELNIKKNKPNLDRLSNMGEGSEEPVSLIKWMLSNRPEDRPTAKQVMQHPFFWTSEKRLNFLCDVSDHWEREPRDPPSHNLSRLESYAETIIGAHPHANFLAKLDKKFIDSLGRQRKYSGDRLLDLLRALRNKKNHYEDMEESVKIKVGPLPEGYLSYWTTRFPKLLMACYECVLECDLQGEPRFRPYFSGDEQ